jgi:hypothetical protein
MHFQFKHLNQWNSTKCWNSWTIMFRIVWITFIIFLWIKSPTGSNWIWSIFMSIISINRIYTFSPIHWCSCLSLFGNDFNLTWEEAVWWESLISRYYPAIWFGEAFAGNVTFLSDQVARERINSVHDDISAAVSSIVILRQFWWKKEWNRDQTATIDSNQSHIEGNLQNCFNHSFTERDHSNLWRTWKKKNNSLSH